MWGIGPSGPPKNRVTTTADMVMAFMNSARKNRAKRIEEYSVLKPADQLGVGLDQVEGRAVELGGDGDQEQDEGHEAEPDHVPVPEVRAPGTPRWPGWTASR